MSGEAGARFSARYLIELLGADWVARYAPRRLWPQEAKSLRQFILDDLIGQVSVLPHSEQRDLLDRAGLSISRQTGKSSVPLMGHARRHADLVVLTVLRVERDAVLAALGEDPNSTETFERDGVFFYRVVVDSKRYAKQFVVWVTMVGEPRNVSCAIFLDRIRQHIDTKAVVLVGIAGGNSKKVKIGNAVSSYEILDDDGGVDLFFWTLDLWFVSFDIRQRQPRVRVVDNYGRLKRLINNFAADEPDWKSRLNTIIEAGDRGALKFFTPLDPEIKFEHKTGLIQAGETLRRDNHLPKRSRAYHDKLLAVEMEGSGFAQACRDKGYDWLVIRGISDLGDHKKRDKEQAIAAASAATLLAQFLATTFSPAQDGVDIEF